jgi:hypothetical protein
MAGRYDIKTVQGDTLIRLFEYVDPDGNPIDLTGFRAIFQVRANPTDLAPLVSLTSDAGGGISFVDPNNNYATDPTAGFVLLKVTKAQAEAASTPGGWYQLKLLDNDDPDFDFTLAFGEYVIYPEVAK